jgi:hypothetical protein
MDILQIYVDGQEKGLLTMNRPEGVRTLFFLRPELNIFI